MQSWTQPEIRNNDTTSQPNSTESLIFFMHYYPVVRRELHTIECFPHRRSVFIPQYGSELLHVTPCDSLATTCRHATLRLHESPNKTNSVGREINTTGRVFNFKQMQHFEWEIAPQLFQKSLCFLSCMQKTKQYNSTTFKRLLRGKVEYGSYV